jgi:two-component system response regulator AtoC
MDSQPAILLVDDEPLERGSLALMLEQEGYSVIAVENGIAALTQLEKKQFDIVLADMKMPRMTGMELLREIKEQEIESEVILITAYGEIKDAVEATKLGAYGFVEKNTQNTDDELKLTIKRALERLDLVRENKTLKTELKHRSQFCQLIGQSNQMQQIYELIDTVADSKASVLIQGETGTGKDLVARAIHTKSSRADRRFMKINCAGVPQDLLESEMFGHVKGAFTTAIRDKIGRFEVADKGTVFLDDIDTLPHELQPKLLRVLQDEQFERVGSTETIQVDVRVIASSNQDLQKLISEGRFRADLFYRLNVVPINISPLRARPGDIVVLSDYFLKKFSELNNKSLNGFSDDAMKMLEEYNWPGNVRELENVIERAVILERDECISAKSLMLFQQESASAAFDADNNGGNDECRDDNDGSLKEEIRYAEKDIIIAALERNKWRRKKTAEELNINRVTLYNKMKKYGLTDK